MERGPGVPMQMSALLHELETRNRQLEALRAMVEASAEDAPSVLIPRLLQILPPEIEFGYVGRPERASPGEGYPAAHTVEQTRIIRTALDLSTAVSVNPAKQPGEARSGRPM